MKEDVTLRKPNRVSSTEPKQGKFWCTYCDAAEIHDGERCPNCKKRDLCNRRKR